MKRIIFVFVLWLPRFASAESLQTASLESIQLLRISPSDERAVVKTPDGKLTLIKVGDTFGDHGGRVIEIAAGRIVIEEKGGKGTEKIIIRLEGDQQRIERIKKEGETPPPLLAPQMTPVDPDRGDGASGGSFTRRPRSREEK